MELTVSLELCNKRYTPVGANPFDAHPFLRLCETVSVLQERCGSEGQPVQHKAGQAGQDKANVTCVRQPKAAWCWMLVTSELAI